MNINESNEEKKTEHPKIIKNKPQNKNNDTVLNYKTNKLSIKLQKQNRYGHTHLHTNTCSKKKKNGGTMKEKK